MLIDVNPGEAERVAMRLVGCEYASYVAASIGKGYLGIQVCARDEGELALIVDEVVGSIPGVMSTRTALVPWRLKDVYEWKIPPEKTWLDLLDVLMTSGRLADSGCWTPGSLTRRWSGWGSSAASAKGHRRRQSTPTRCGDVRGE